MLTSAPDIGTRFNQLHLEQRLGSFPPSLASPVPLLQAPPVQDNTVPSHTPLLDVRPRGRNQDKPVCYCVASCINIWDEETRSITSWVRTTGSGHRQLARQVGAAARHFLF